MSTETRTVSIKDREIEVSRVTETQFMLMGREMTRVKRVIESKDVGSEQVPGLLRSMGFVLDVIESRVVKQEDKDYLTDLMAQGELEFGDVLPLVQAFFDEEAESKPVVSRGRTNRTKR